MIGWATRRPAVVWAAVLALILTGSVASNRIVLATRTSVELPRLLVTAAWPGASAELIEMLVTAPIEAAIHGVRSVRRTSSVSREGVSQIMLDLEPAADMPLTRLGVRERLEVLRPSLPPGASHPVVGNFVPDALSEQPLLRVTLSGPFTNGTLQRVAEAAVLPRLRALPGVGGLTVFGGAQFGIAVSYDPGRLRRIGLSPEMLAREVARARQVVALGGAGADGARRPVVLQDQPGSLAALEALPVRRPDGRVFRLGEVAAVRVEEDAGQMFYRINGVPAIAFTVTREAGADAIATAARVRAMLDAASRALPTGMRMAVGADDSVALRHERRNLLIRGSIAFGAVSMVLLLMLGSLRDSALVMGSAMVALAGTALGLFILGIPANMLSLAGLGMAIGVLVQSAIVIVEPLRTSSDNPDARARVARRMVPVVMSSTLTTAVLLLPFLYLQGDARSAFVPFAVAFGLAIGWSALVALLVVPVAARGIGVPPRPWNRLQRLYGRGLARLLRWRWVALCLLLAALGALAWGFVAKVRYLDFGFGGIGDRTTVAVRLTFPRGFDPEALDAAIRNMEQTVVRHPGVEDVTSQGDGEGRASMRVTIAPDAEVSPVPAVIEDQLIQHAMQIGGAHVSVRGQGPGFAQGGGDGSTFSFSIKVSGYSFRGVEQIALDLKARLERMTRVSEVDANAADLEDLGGAWTAAIVPDRIALARFGVTAEDLATAVSREVRSSLRGPRLTLDGENVPVVVRALGARERSLMALRQALVQTSAGSVASIGALASVHERRGAGTIMRENQRYIRVVRYTFRGPSRLAMRTHQTFMRSITVPAGYSIVDVGSSGSADDGSARGLWVVFGIGVALVLLVVAFVFDSVWAAGMVLLSLPVALGGVSAAFWITDTAFTREAAVGVILVCGLAVHQGILFLDAVLGRRRSTADVHGDRRILTAALVWRSAMERSTVIMLVTLTSLASLVPLAAGMHSASTFGGIALATAGGVVFGMFGAMAVLPLLTVPLRQPRRMLSPPIAGRGEQ